MKVLVLIFTMYTIIRFMVLPGALTVVIRTWKQHWRINGNGPSSVKWQNSETFLTFRFFLTSNHNNLSFEDAISSSVIMRLHYELYTINSVSHRGAAGTLSFGVWDAWLKPNKICGVMRQSDYDTEWYDVIRKKHECVCIRLCRVGYLKKRSTQKSKLRSLFAHAHDDRKLVAVCWWNTKLYFRNNI